MQLFQYFGMRESGKRYLVGCIKWYDQRWNFYNLIREIMLRRHAGEKEIFKPVGRQPVNKLIDGLDRAIKISNQHICKKCNFNLV